MKTQFSHSAVTPTAVAPTAVAATGFRVMPDSFTP